MFCNRVNGKSQSKNIFRKLGKGMQKIGLAALLTATVGIGYVGCEKEPERSISEERLYQQSKIAFSSKRDGNKEIYVMNADGTDQKRLTNNPADDSVLSWSLDGKKIAFTSNRDGNTEIYVMNADGTEQTRLTNNRAWDFKPSWSPYLQEKKK